MRLKKHSLETEITIHRKIYYLQKTDIDEFLIHLQIQNVYNTMQKHKHSVNILKRLNCTTKYTA